MVNNPPPSTVDSGGRTDLDKGLLAVDIVLGIASVLSAIFTCGATAAANAARQAAQTAARLAAKKAAEVAAKKTAKEAAEKTLKEATEKAAKAAEEAAKKEVDRLAKEAGDAAADGVEKKCGLGTVKKIGNGIDITSAANDVTQAGVDKTRNDKASKDAQARDAKLRTVPVAYAKEVEAAKLKVRNTTEDYNKALDDYHDAKHLEKKADQGVRDFNEAIKDPKVKEKYPDAKPIPVETHAVEHHSADLL